MRCLCHVERELRNNRKKLRKFIEKEHMLWYPRRGGVYLEILMEKRDEYYICRY